MRNNFKASCCTARKSVFPRLCAIMLLAVLVCVLPAAGYAAPGKPLKNLFAGKTISIMGDSISTYTGWSDKYPITDESCTNRYGEAYYGPEGGDFHNTDMLVSDTWWYQAAEQTKAKILVSNAGNSTGVFAASYPANAGWDLYLKEMLAWKSRPYHLGLGSKKPDIIALYIGSNEVARCKVSEMGSIDQVNFDQLVSRNSDGTYTYATPATVAEAYCILLHKISVTYPKAEVYCFQVLPNAGGTVVTGNKRMPPVVAFNDMLEGVAAHFGAIIVDLPAAFNLDPDEDGVVTEETWNTFKTYFHNDPHPNAEGFDVITKAFVNTAARYSRYSHGSMVKMSRNADQSEEIWLNTEGIEDMPVTGDTSNMVLWAALMLIGLTGMMVIRRRKNA